MGDSYRPSRAPPRFDRGRRGDDDGMTYRPSRDHYDQEHTRGDGSFTFRGAASGRHDHYSPQEQFTFQASGGPAAPRFPPQQPPPRARPGTDKRNDRWRNGGPGDRPKRRPYPHKWVPKPAHSRDLLKHVDREGTPEQLLGMTTDSQPRYVEVIESSDEESDSDDSTGGEAADDDGEGARKRTKTESTAEPARPKWSNPDPYSVLPPTDLGVQPKKDIVHTIRKAKANASAQGNGTDAVSHNDDFISFDLGDEEDEEEEENDTIGALPPPPPGFVMPTDEDLMESYVGNVDSKKRKRGSEATKPSAIGGRIVEEWQPNHTNSTPWVRQDATVTSNVGLHRLHKEMVDFYEYVRPHPHETEIRLDLIGRVERAVRSFTFASKRVEIRSFGSFAVGLYLPVADMDLVAVTPEYMSGGRKSFCQNPRPMYALAEHLKSWGLVAPRSMAVIHRAKVPIIKFVDAETGIKVDISFENDSGLHAVSTVEKWKEDFPEMPLLVAFIKQLLAMRGLNEVFTGGIGGFTIICLVVSMLQLMPENQRNSLDERSRYGELLLNFLDLYGNKFDLVSTGIMMNPPGYFDKDDFMEVRLKKNKLSIIDPNRPDNDISGGSNNIHGVLTCFSGAQLLIQRRLNDIRTGKRNFGSILECVIGGDYSSFVNQRVKLNRINETMLPPPPPPARNPSPPSSRAYPPEPRQYRGGPPPPPPTRNYHDSFPRQPSYPESQSWQTQSWQPYQHDAYSAPQHVQPSAGPRNQPPQRDHGDDPYGGSQNLPQHASKAKKAKKEKAPKPQKPAPKTVEPKPTTKSEKKKKKKAGKKSKKSKGSQSGKA